MRCRVTSSTRIMSVATKYLPPRHSPVARFFSASELTFWYEKNVATHREPSSKRTITSVLSSLGVHSPVSHCSASIQIEYFCAFIGERYNVRHKRRAPTQNDDERHARARVRCMPLLGSAD